MKPVPLPTWLNKLWPFDAGRRAVVGDYVAIGSQHKHFLADVALRGGVFRAFDPAADGTLEGFNGRRELALEIIKIARIDPQHLFGLLAELPREDKR